MLLVSIMLLSVVSLSAAQVDTNCQCVASHFCTSTVNANINCGSYLLVCCNGGTEPSAPNETPDPTEAPIPPEAPVTTEAPVPEPAADRNLVCGVRGKPKRDDGSFDIDWRIVSETGVIANTSRGEFPWMVAILKENPDGEQDFIAGGSVIYPNIILTTAHSLSNLSVSSLKVKAGIWKNTDVTEISMHQNPNVLEVILHPGFDKKRVANDIALLVLSEPVNYTDNIAPICLPELETVVNTSACIAIGWGASSFGQKKVQSVLKMVNLPLVDYTTCQSKLREVPRLGQNFNLHNSFICAGDGKSDTCTGDGGGPLFCAMLADKNRYVQIGITSWGIGCGQGTPGVYASVRTAADWINGQVATHLGSAA